MKVFYKMAIALLLFVGNNVLAAPGDTTWVHANDVQLDYFNNFDEDVSFPDDSKTYRKILMYFTLGKYNCPSGSQYCHQWDYTVLNYVMTETDTVEISRLITPFATSGWSRFAGDWKQPYVFDVTDYAPLLVGDAAVRIHYSGYSGGFTANVKFAFIEGTPERDVIGVERVYNGSFQYGNANNPINENLSAVALTSPEGTKDARVNVLITGHGSDNNQCCEFRKSNYRFELNGGQIANQEVWKDDCGLNHLYPQGGTWIYDRANWCPGEAVQPIYHTIGSAVNDGDIDYSVRMRFNQYSGSGEFGSYAIAANVIYYGAMNKQLDVSLEKVIAPTDDWTEYRNNPGNSTPEVLVRNTGADEITSIKFLYGIQDSVKQEYEWTGTIAPLEERRVVLDDLASLEHLILSDYNGNATFSVEVLEVNGAMDDDATNNLLTSTFKVAPVLNGDLVIDFKTSSMGANGSQNSNPADASWKITDGQGNTVFARENNDTKTQYIDTISFAEPGIYKLKISATECAGLYWWAFGNGLPGYTGGHFKLKNANGATIPMENYKYTGMERDDFGCAFEFYFAITEPGVLGVDNLGIIQEDVEIYPNPAREDLNIVLATNSQLENLFIVNELGAVVHAEKIVSSTMNVSTKSLSAGVYTVLLNNEQGQVTRKVIIQK